MKLGGISPWTFRLFNLYLVHALKLQIKSHESHELKLNLGILIRMLCTGILKWTD